MEAGLLNKKVAFVIQARMKSTRLPGKILLPIPLGSNKVLLSWIIDELKLSKFNNEIIVASSINPENEALVPFCMNNKINIFRGSEENVLSRFVSITQESEYSCIVRLTGDNPLIDIKILDNTIKCHLLNNNDYTKTEGLPIGMNFEVISPDALLTMDNYNLSDSDKEHVTQFIRNSSKFKKEDFVVDIEVFFKNLRLTVDYASDYTLISSILSQVSEFNSLKGIELIKATYLKFPWLFESNFLNFQKKHYSTIDLEIKEAYEVLDQFELKNASIILKKYLES